MTTDACGYDDDEIDDWPTQMGRTPVGPPINIYLSTEASQAVHALAAPFGTRHRSGVVRVAFRRLLADPHGLPAIVDQRVRNRATRPRFPVLMNLHLDTETADQLKRLAQQLDTSRAELARIAVDRFLLELAQQRLAGNPFDLEAALIDELFQAEANRDRLIRRGRQRQAERLTQAVTAHPE